MMVMGNPNTIDVSGVYPAYTEARARRDAGQICPKEKKVKRSETNDTSNYMTLVIIFRDKFVFYQKDRGLIRKLNKKKQRQLLTSEKTESWAIIML